MILTPGNCRSAIILIEILREATASNRFGCGGKNELSNELIAKQVDSCTHDLSCDLDPLRLRGVDQHVVGVIMDILLSYFACEGSTL